MHFLAKISTWKEIKFFIEKKKKKDKKINSDILISVYVDRNVLFLTFFNDEN